jgi:hypothetical protein
MALENGDGRQRFRTKLDDEGRVAPELDYSSDADGYSNELSLAALQKLNRVLDLAMAQQALAGGLTLFAAIDRGVKAHDAKTLALLRDNPNMAANYVHWRLRIESASPESNAAYIIAYRAAENETVADERFMEGFAPTIDTHWHPGVDAEACPDGTIQPVPGGWYARLDTCLNVPLPTPEQFRSGRYEFGGVYKSLIASKAKIADALAQYAFLDKDAVDDASFRYAVVRPLL